jgi:adenylate cyclase
MQQKIINWCRYYLGLIFTWILAYFLLLFLQFDPIASPFWKDYISIFNLVSAAVITGLGWGTIQKVLRSYRGRIPSHALVVFITSLVQVVSTWCMIFCVSFLAKVISNGIFTESDFHEIMGFYSDSNFFVILLYTFFISSIIDFVMDIDQKLGSGVLWNFMKGRYHKPREEERIFMFMDLKSSTYYAEQLGHLKYSSLIQDCFHDLTQVAMKNKAQIYQYVGDEVVLTWNMKTGTHQGRCINTYFEFMQVISGRSHYYRETYGIVPVFKAGVNCGKITVAEVGDLKREIAYHGDAINTASRIQGLCNSFGKRFLVSEAVLRHLVDFEMYGHYELLGNLELKGKDHQVEIYSLNPKTETILKVV